MNIDGLNTKYEVDNHLQQLSELRDVLNDSVREFINFPESNTSFIAELLITGMDVTGLNAFK